MEAGAQGQKQESLGFLTPDSVEMAEAKDGSEAQAKPLSACRHHKEKELYLQERL